MIVYVLFVHKISVSKRKVYIIFIKNKKFKKSQKTHFSGFFGWVFLGGFFGVVFFYCQPCLLAVRTLVVAEVLMGVAHMAVQHLDALVHRPA